MMPGMNPRMMKQAMKRMGIQQEELEATEVIIKLPGKEIIIKNPQVSKVNMMGQMTWQVVGDAQEQHADVTPEISEDDVQTVVDQTGVSAEEARAAIEICEGDLAEAIIKLQEE
jgi:nascent polypeptide-associated complex subunit alpha